MRWTAIRHRMEVITETILRYHITESMVNKMGDRSNIAIVQNETERVYLYGHWMGNDSIQIVRDVLERYDRWNDAPYLARMLFSEMIKNELDSSTGYGISTSVVDNEYPIIALDPERQLMWLEEHDSRCGDTTSITNDISFDTFLEEHQGDCDLYELVNNMNTLNGSLTEDEVA